MQPNKVKIKGPCTDCRSCPGIGEFCFIWQIYIAILVASVLSFVIDC